MKIVCRFQLNLVLCLAFLSSVFCQDADNGQPKDVELSKGIVISLGTIMMILGLMFLFVGKYFLRVIVFVSGAILAGFLAVSLFRYIRGDVALTLGWKLGAVVAALVGGFLGVFFLRLGIMILGGLCGVGITFLIKGTGLIKNSTTLTIIGLVLVIVLGIAAAFASDLIIIVATSFSGAVLFMVGLDFFVKTGFGSFILNFNFKQPLQVTDGHVIIMLISTLILAVIGFFFQQRVFNSSQ
ncbi:hypothetical protein DSO57_1010905 [Entomophthora muscae]|uniref:Uncharacterized protein n=1 Tax=Entomophthora muscae TaxID=34485 RepID=A0ACC2U4Q8_9FUNG|nr:hypothetical protein DSO57_1010905 [Entomophthora muscae]